MVFEIEINPANMLAVRRMNTLLKTLSPRPAKFFDFGDKISINTCGIFCKHSSTHAGKVTIGDVSLEITCPKNPEYVPIHYTNNLSNLSDLRWMLQKDKLGQDMFLVGPPGWRRRQLVMTYLELRRKELEFVSLSRDTTEADLKQRREIRGNSAEFVHQSAVKAAIEGRILVLEGIEKAERNVLPVLNNLLENREMHLEDGTFLISPKNYDELLKEHGKEKLDAWNLIRVSEEFRVIALGLPVPAYIGNPLDPPLRSRFQARDISPSSYEEMKKYLSIFANAPVGKLDKLLSCAYAFNSHESKAMGLPDLPIDNVFYAAKILNLDPSVNVISLLERLYPFSNMGKKEEKSAVKTALKVLNIPDVEQEEFLQIVDLKESGNERIFYLNNNTVLKFPSGKKSSAISNNVTSNYVALAYHDHLLADFTRTHAACVDFCLLGPSGCGKSVLARKFAQFLGLEIEPIVMYQDMTSRDLIQQRSTLPNGDTVWKHSPLVVAALEGKIALLDGIHRVHTSTLSILHRLIHDRELQLYDGCRLVREDRYDALTAISGSENRLKDAGVMKIHPSFRIIALAENPGGHNPHWITPEILSLFLFHCIRPLTRDEECRLIKSTYGELDENVEKAIAFAQNLRNSSDSAILSLSPSLSTRQLLRMAKSTATYGKCDVYECIQQACLSKFLPQLTRQMLHTMLDMAKIYPTQSSFWSGSPRKECSVDENNVKIGDTVVPRYKPANSSKVPNTLFYHSPQHNELLEKLLRDFSMGENLLLVGNQGVGKNKLVDKLLHMLNRPREYIQLHRDTTVQSLTLQPTVSNGLVTYEDSPLVKAVQIGHVLVVDEADKAPTHVTCIFKTLVESGEMILSDGRRIVPKERVVIQGDKCIKTHPEFRVIMLANRPGFPFLGNNLFAALGDLFSCHVVDNPSEESEISLLKNYGPDVPFDVIRRIVRAFGQLREMADRGVVSYPYSTREAVNIVKHLQAYPNDDLTDAVSNVFDFDRYNAEIRDTLQRVLADYDIKVNFQAIKANKNKNLQMTVETDSGLDVSGPKHGKVDEDGNPHVGGNTWAGGTGGRDTAGLGGKGGPYRLDSRHTVYQLSDEEKNSVPEHVRKAAVEMGKKAFQDRLKEIKMSQYDAKLYEKFSGSISKQVQALRIILTNLKAKSKERQWTTNQTSGDLDDAKLVEGITGERAIYKRRSEVEPELGAPQMKPKRLRLVVDVSGSMYRFNGYDGRLDREMEAVIMVMEAFQGFENRIQCDIVGHSGESECITFVSKTHPPANNKDRLDVIKTMHAHAQFCMSGDNTLEAIVNAIDTLESENEEFDEGIVIVLSDANLARYGIPARHLATVLKRSDCVTAYIVFIGSLGNQAAVLKNALPTGRGFVCMNLEEIPKIIQQIFSSSLLAY